MKIQFESSGVYPTYIQYQMWRFSFNKKPEIIFNAVWHFLQAFPIREIGDL